MNTENNQVTIIGKITNEPAFHHETLSEKFYEFIISVSRISGTVDEIKAMVSERLILNTQYSIGDVIKIDGQFRSYDLHEGGKNQLQLHVFAQSIFRYDGAEQQDFNVIHLTGFICKKPIYRTTPQKREITDLLLAVNRDYNKSDYIPIIVWGRNAKFAEQLEVGTKVHICGRIQSRKYEKKTENSEAITKTAYEVSGSMIELLGENNRVTEE